MLKLRKTLESDLDVIMGFVRDAQSYLQYNNVEQWQNNYPNESVFMQDIAKGESYIVENNGEVLGTIAASFSPEPTYEKIFDGEWLTNSNYVVLHRITVDSKYKGTGLAAFMFECIKNICLDKNVFSIKVDTHKNNSAMTSCLKKNGFIYCGVIYLHCGSERVAFEKVLK